MRKRETEKENAKRELNEAVDVVNAFIRGEYKSIYLMDSWMMIMDYITNTNK